MMNKWVLLVSTCAVLLGFAQEMAQATCESGEENVLLQTMNSSKDHHAGCWKDINMTQTAWKELILAISKSYLDDGDFIEIAKVGIDKLYGYDIGTVMFKPTKATVNQFRPTFEGALSYFVGYDAISPAGYPEDGGFAINNGEGWKEVVIKNYDISCNGDLAIAQGYYFFTNANATDEVTGVEYTWVYKRMDDGHLKIIVHHSSVPFPMPAASLMQEDKEVRKVEEKTTQALGAGDAWKRRRHGYRHKPHYKPYSCSKSISATQKAWQKTILDISNSYLEDGPDGDYIEIAEDRINELYGYDIGPVMFKPTKAAVDPFRPTFIGALSYFVGYDALSPTGYKEDGGFAINDGQGWKEVVIENNETSCVGDFAIAQGNYYFTNETSDTVKVEYSWVYKIVDKDNLKIIVHHSSLPFSSPSLLQEDKEVKKVEVKKVA